MLEVWGVMMLSLVLRMLAGNVATNLFLLLEIIIDFAETSAVFVLIKLGNG